MMHNNDDSDSIPDLISSESDGAQSDDPSAEIEPKRDALFRREYRHSPRSNLAEARRYVATYLSPTTLRVSEERLDFGGMCITLQSSRYHRRRDATERRTDGQDLR